MAVFHLLDEQELTFRFERPTRFRDMEGEGSVLADPSLIAPQYSKALEGYLGELDEAVRDAAVDYHRVRIQEAYEEVLARFLIRRTPKKGGAR